MTAATTTSDDLRVSVERMPGSQVSLTIEAPAEHLERAVDQTLRRYARQIRLPGFRPGKAPLAMIERQFTWEALRQEVIEALIPDLYVQALEREQIEPVSEPRVDIDPATVERGKPVTFTATVTVTPEIELGDYASIRVEKPATEITDADVDEAIEEVRRNRSELTEVDRPARIGDVLTAVLEMRNGDELLTAEAQEREIDLDPERLLTGLAEKIEGMSAGEDRTFTLVLPEDYPREDLRGKEVGVTCALRTVRERTMPPLDDSLAEADKHGPTLAEMRDFYRNLLVQQAAERDTETFETNVLTAFRESLSVDVPDAMVEAELDRQLRDLEYQFSSMGLPWEQYLSITGQTTEELRGQRREGAIQRVLLNLGLDALARAESIEVDEAAVERTEKRIAQGQKLSAGQRRRLHQMTHVDLARQAAATRLLDIARGEG